jgi:uncharacterized RDD family membrane protein YckC
MQSFSFGGYLGTPGAIEGVGFWPRAAARLIDTVVHFVVNVCTGLAFGVALGIYADLTSQPAEELVARAEHAGLLSYALALVGFVAYYSIAEAVHGSTIGKRMLSMVVVQEDGSPCRFGPALVRNLAYFIDSLFFGLIGYFAMQKTPQQQRYGDQWAHTIVCKRAAVAPHCRRGDGRFVLGMFLGALADSALVALGLLSNMAS